jgi:hypothetical protein
VVLVTVLCPLAFAVGAGWFPWGPRPKTSNLMYTEIRAQERAQTIAQLRSAIEEVERFKLDVLSGKSVPQGATADEWLKEADQLLNRLHDQLRLSEQALEGMSEVSRIVEKYAQFGELLKKSP